MTDSGESPGEQALRSLIAAPARTVGVHDVVRYAKGGSHVDVELDRHLNFHFLTHPGSPGAKRLLLEAGINRIAPIQASDGSRRPAILLRSSPWKAGHESNPWKDVYDLDHGHVRYFGDHKPSTVGPVGATPGNRALLSAWDLHGSPSRQDRALAPPLLLFRAVPSLGANGKRVHKGYLEFSGVAIIERLEMVVQRDPQSPGTFPNLAIDLVVVGLEDQADSLDWRWIDARRNPSLTAADSLSLAPAGWQRWVHEGRSALSRVRRRVLSSRVKTGGEQRPMPGTREAEVLNKIHRHFDSHKHAFEHLAATVAAQVFQESGARYQRGWLTRAGGDGGMDFVGRLDAGGAHAHTPLVVLGQAKCIKPTSSISPDEVARVVARLRRGWIGVFVTTGVFSKQAQVEVIDDEYPVVLISGGLLAQEVIKLAELAFNGDVEAALAAASAGYENDVTHRRPEEILAQA